MTVRIGTGSSAVDPSALRVAGVSPSKIMLGTGSAAVEVWSASEYPASGTWGPVPMGFFQVVDILTHTMSESGNFTFTVTGNSTNVTFGYKRNGSSMSNSPTWTANLVQGDTIVVQAAATSDGTYSGTWSIVKN